MKHRFAISIFVLAASIAISGCGNSSEPCDSCGNTQTKAYTNTASNKKEYYCKDCSSKCFFCSDNTATEHYTAAIGEIVFICKDCKKSM